MECEKYYFCKGTYWEHHRWICPLLIRKLQRLQHFCMLPMLLTFPPHPPFSPSLSLSLSLCLSSERSTYTKANNSKHCCRYSSTTHVQCMWLLLPLLADPKFAPILEAGWLAGWLTFCCCCCCCCSSRYLENFTNFIKLFVYMYIVFFCCFPFFGCFPQDSLANTTNNVRDARTPCFLIIEVVVSKHLSLSFSLSHLLRHHLGQWGCYGWININRYYGIEFHSSFNQISSLHLRLLWSDYPLIR